MSFFIYFSICETYCTLSFCLAAAGGIKAQNPLKSGLSSKKKEPQPRYALYQNHGSYLENDSNCDTNNLPLRLYEVYFFQVLFNLLHSNSTISFSLSSQSINCTANPYLNMALFLCGGKSHLLSFTAYPVNIQS